MEIPVINRIGDFEAGIISLQNPSFLSQVFTLSGIENIHRAYGFWKWGALILALVASFSTIISRIKILIIRIQNHYLVPSPSPFIAHDSCSSDGETDDMSCSSYSSDDEEQIEEDDDDDENERNAWRPVDEDYSVKGSAHYIDDQWHSHSLRRRRNRSLEDLFSSWSEFTNGKNVVKLWDNLGLRFGLNLENDSSRNCVSFYDINKELNVFSIVGQKSDVPQVSTSSSSSAVIVSTETNLSGNLLRVWDTRVGSRIPEILAEWRPKLGKFVGISGGGGGVEKVYVRDDVLGRLTVGDMRKAKSLLVNATETDVDTWWDADAVIVGKEDEGDLVSRCG